MPRPKLTPEERAARNAARQAVWRERAKERGLTRINVAVEPDATLALDSLALVHSLTQGELLTALLNNALSGLWAMLDATEKSAFIAGTLRKPLPSNAYQAPVESLEAAPPLDLEPLALAPTKDYPLALKARAVTMHQQGESRDAITAMLIAEHGKAPDKSNWARTMKAWGKASR
ncbi:hypothetical protein SAMN05421644_1653 [Allochromatium warmingii]|uniref:Uncharacterized protein n=1 Tax=Allochromatium warmingii TaxID=61595 RepID=A0A1H3JTV5_ALLWA|nr:hypothetical protein [Allochromatium warmingii]SDY42798.1 hypothetical protein SAMN05421644_1653 [Allochromatium warmingii]